MIHTTSAVVLEAEILGRLPAGVQQLVMESNGKTARGAGVESGGAALATSPVIWGACGTTAQHSFFQQLHQGPDCIPVEFILARSSEGRTAQNDERQRILLANALAQASALAIGQPEEPRSAREADPLTAHRAFPGNRPSTVLTLNDLSARSLGALLACYEHATFTAATMLGINPFDQFGVELGKRVAIAVEQAILNPDASESGHAKPAAHSALDASTAASLRRLL